MKNLLIILVFFLLVLPQSNAEVPEDIYLIIYISKDGKTGHVGMAVDNYKVVVKEDDLPGNTASRYDTIKDNTLTYFDLWGPNDIDLSDHNKNLEARYYKLPRTSAEKKLNVDYFLSKGLPHAYDYPCDALIKIKSTPKADYELKNLASYKSVDKNYFNTRKYNCVDYINECIEEIYGIELNAKEFIPFTWSSTPNKFYKEIIEKMNVDIIKKPSEDVNNSFFKERIIRSI